jgi:hypothetical protein
MGTINPPEPPPDNVAPHVIWFLSMFNLMQLMRVTPVAKGAPLPAVPKTPEEVPVRGLNLTA